MRIGILICDDVNPLLQDVHKSYEVMFTEHFGRVDPECELAFYRVIDGELPTHPDECQGYITSGSKYGVNDDFPWIRQLEQFVRQLKAESVPYVGICFGHQMLARALGGEVTLAPVGWGVGYMPHMYLKRSPGCSRKNMTSSCLSATRIRFHLCQKVLMFLPGVRSARQQ